MLKIKVILCPVDFSEFSVRAFRHAVSLAHHYRAKLVALHVVELWQHPAASFAVSAELYDQYSHVLRERASAQLQEFVKKYAHHEVQPELVVDVGRAPDSILWYADARQADVIVMGTHGRRGYDRLMLGSATDRVMRRASCPVLAVYRPPLDSGDAGDQLYVHHLRRILFCTDFSGHSARALDHAISATEEHNAELTLLHVLEQVPSHARTAEAIAEATARLDNMIPPERRKNLKIKTAVRIGKPYQQIIDLATQTQTDLVIMGVRGHGALDLAVFGSTTYRVIQLGPCPVLVYA